MNKLFLTGLAGSFIISLVGVSHLINHHQLAKPSIKGVEATQSAKLIDATPAATPSSSPLSIPINSGKQIRVPIIYYHYIGNNPNPADKARDTLSTTPDKFEEQMSYLAKEQYTPITLDTMMAGLTAGLLLPAKPIVLTFDDGYVDFYINAYPILKRFNFHSVSFIPTGLIGQSYYLNWDQIKEMDQSGLISFQAHTVHHSNLVSLPTSQITFEVRESKQVLENQLGKPVNFFAYPYGASNEYAWNEVKKAGFLGAVGTWSGVIESEGNIFDMPRMRVGGNIDLPTFTSKL